MKYYEQKFEVKKDMIKFAKQKQERFVKSIIVQLLNKDEQKYGDFYTIELIPYKIGNQLLVRKWCNNHTGKYPVKEIELIIK